MRTATLENAGLYNMKGQLASDAGSVEISRARVQRRGTDVTVITYGAGLWKSLEAAKALAQEGIEAEVIDLRTLRPLDEATFLDSVSRMHRAVVVDDGWRSGGLSAEISARIMEKALYQLDAPIERICGVEVPAPYAKHLEDVSLPQASQIVSSVRRMVRHE